MLEPVWNRNYLACRADHDGREVRRRGPRPLLRPGGGAARRGRQPPPAAAGHGGDGAAARAATRRRSRTPSSRCSGRWPTLTPPTTCAGQYEGYREIDGVASDSTTETYAALRLEIDNWRWAGVPFFIRTGKLLPATQTELRLLFRRPPRVHFVRAEHRAPEPNQIVSRSTRAPGSGSSSTPTRADRGGTADIHARHGVRPGGRRGRQPRTRCCCTRPSSATAPTSRARTASRRPGG